MEQCAKAAEDFKCRRSRCGVVEGFQEGRGCADKEVVLVGGALECEAALGGILCEGGEIDMGCDVFFARFLKRGFVAPVFGIAGQCATRAMRGEEFAPGHAVVDGQKKTAAKALGEIADQLVLVAAEFGPKSVGTLGQAGVCEWMLRKFERQAAIAGVDQQLMPVAALRFHEVEGKCIEKLV